MSFDILCKYVIYDRNINLIAWFSQYFQIASHCIQLFDLLIFIFIGQHTLHKINENNTFAGNEDEQ